MSSPQHGVGHNQAPDDNRRETFSRAITLWVENKRLDDALTQDDLCALEGGQRFFALGKSLICNQIKLCRSQPRADTRAGVLTLITFLSDWEKTRCACTLATTRMAELLARSERGIRDAIDSLEKDGLIFVNRTANGLPNSYYPAVPAVVATMNPANVWFVNALSTERKPGRPRLVVSGADENPRKQSSGDCEKPWNERSGGIGKTPEAERKNRGSRGAQDSTLEFSRSEESCSFGPQWDDFYSSFHWLCNRWGVAGEGPIRVPELKSRQRLDAIVAKVRHRYNVPDDEFTVYLGDALSQFETAEAKGQGFSTGANYFSALLNGTVEKGLIEKNLFEAKVTMAQEGLDARASSSRTARRPKASADDIFEAARRSFKGGRA